MPNAFFLADKLFPEEQFDRHTFFDANHDCKRLFRWPRKEKKRGEGFTDLKNPWRPFIPTMTGLSNIACRVLRRSPEPNGPPILTIRRVHPMECMRVMGWDLEFFTQGRFGTVRVPGEEKEHCVDADLLQDMVGDAWCAWETALQKTQDYLHGVPDSQIIEG